MFRMNAKDLNEKIEKYKDHHIFIDELAIHDHGDIAIVKDIDEKFKSVSIWLAITQLKDPNIEEKLENHLTNFKIVKNELKLPLRNTTSIAKQAYNLEEMTEDTIQVKGRGGIAGVDDDEYDPMPDEELNRGVDGVS